MWFQFFSLPPYHRTKHHVPLDRWCNKVIAIFMTLLLFLFPISGHFWCPFQTLVNLYYCISCDILNDWKTVYDIKSTRKDTKNSVQILFFDYSSRTKLTIKGMSFTNVAWNFHENERKNLEWKCPIFIWLVVAKLSFELLRKKIALLRLDYTDNIFLYIFYFVVHDAQRYKCMKIRPFIIILSHLDNICLKWFNTF